MICGALGVVAALGYAYDLQPFYRFAGYTSMAVHTAAGFIVLAIGLIFARPDGLVRVLISTGPGTQLSRRLLPVAILLPVIFGWLYESGSKAGLFTPPVVQACSHCR